MGSKRGRGTTTGGNGASRGPRKKMILDVLLEYESDHLLKGYNHEQLTELHSKIFELEKEVALALDLTGEVDTVLGAKMDAKVMWFYVRWEDGECSFVPATVLNKISPDKVIQYYESIMQFQPADPEAPIPEPKPRPETKLTREPESRKPPTPPRTKMEENVPPPNVDSRSASADSKRPAPAFTPGPTKSFRTMNCTGCNILLQYPEGTKAIKCPVCNTVMHAR